MTRAITVLVMIAAVVFTAHTDVLASTQSMGRRRAVYRRFCIGDPLIGIGFEAAVTKTTKHQNNLPSTPISVVPASGSTATAGTASMKYAGPSRMALVAKIPDYIVSQPEVKLITVDATRGIPDTDHRNPVSITANKVGDRWRSAMDEVVIAGLMDEVFRGEISKRKPELRSRLAWYIYSHPFTERAYEVYALLAGGSAGNTTKKKVANLSSWSERSMNGKYAPIMTYYAGYHLYCAMKYNSAQAYIGRYITKYNEYLDRIYILKALCSMQKNDSEGALEDLRKVQNDFPKSPANPEAAFLSAWILLQDNDRKGAGSLLRKLIEEHPRSSSAGKAQLILSELGEGS